MNPAALALLEYAPTPYKRMMLQRLRWRSTMHHFQAPPAGSWFAWMLQAGRGSGKTRTGAQDVTEYALDRPQRRIAVVAPIYSDGRDVCIEGESGVVSVLDEMGMAPRSDYEWNRSIGELRFENKSLIKVYSSETPDRLRGPQHHRAWCEELGSWRDAHRGDVLQTTFNNLTLGLRLGDDPRIIVTTTPRRVALVRELADRDDAVVTRGSTYDNIENLAPTFADVILRYEGSQIGRQEIWGELLQEVEGALWKTETIDRYRMTEDEAAGVTRKRVVVGVDPQGGAVGTGGTTGIVAAAKTGDDCACGLGNTPHALVLVDGSISATPKGWARQVIDVFDETEADLIVPERNFGGQMVEDTIKTERPGAPVKMVVASRGKAVRAEPISALYESGRVHHIGTFPELEDQMTGWTPDDDWSPDRLDALVWALTELDLAVPTFRARSRRARTAVA